MKKKLFYSNPDDVLRSAGPVLFSLFSSSPGRRATSPTSTKVDPSSSTCTTRRSIKLCF